MLKRSSFLRGQGLVPEGKPLHLLYQTYGREPRRSSARSRKTRDRALFRFVPASIGLKLSQFVLCGVDISGVDLPRSKECAGCCTLITMDGTAREYTESRGLGGATAKCNETPFDAEMCMRDCDQPTGYRAICTPTCFIPPGSAGAKSPSHPRSILLFEDGGRDGRGPACRT